jgi:hypothetical protein
MLRRFPDRRRSVREIIGAAELEYAWEQSLLQLANLRAVIDNAVRVENAGEFWRDDFK